MNTPTPRTDAAWSSSFEGKQLSAGQTARALRECSQKLESELTALTAERDDLHAQLRALTLICGTNDANKFQTWIDRANARAERAEAELAAERDELRAEVELWEAKCHELIAPHYIIDPCLRAAKFREALAFHPVIRKSKKEDAK